MSTNQGVSREPAPASAGAEHVRARIVEVAAVEAATAWADACRADLVRDGRRVEGGWPGTIGEARAHVALGVGAVLRRRALRALTVDELSSATRLAYGAARRAWLAGAERE